jgi:hypothetical protein
MIEHLARNWGNWASVVGLAFSMLAFVFSKRASKAAQEARDSTLQRSFGQDMSDATRAAREVVTFVMIERGDLALLKAGDLVNETSYLVQRWIGHLAADSHRNLLTARQHLQSIQTVLSKQTIQELTPEGLSRLRRSSHKASLIFSEELGVAIKHADKG